ncbi:carbohydrate-binding family 9-like protein [Salinibacter altiplanensis]|uniref:carbohydrate-binding family 9-like protein n=1 Tax=Salinibacter altiplanensis TaxID=1803181 RepID=UPI001F294A41|nr:carbohydrate-binding family 9-like protein [Salinibacter altiplanensis]
MQRILLSTIFGVFVFALVGGEPGSALMGRSERTAGRNTAAETDPRTYAIYRASGPITVDGRLDEGGWAAAPWTADFVDIRGQDAPTPRFRTRAKMLWDDEALYVAATLEEPNVWATLTQRDTVVYYDNDFEVFIDPTGTTHNYYEVEINARETVWDLMLLKPYRDGGPALDTWDMQELEAAVDVKGTLNDPSDTDEGWTVELALPWSALEEAAPDGRPSRPGEQWRLNFSRVQWPTTVVEGRYEKDIDTTEAHPEGNWVWSPQGAIDMHRPEHWGIVQFADAEVGTAAAVSVDERPNRRIKAALRRLYHRQRAHHDEHGTYATALSALNASDVQLPERDFAPTLRTTQTMYEISAPGVEGTTVHIRQDGRVWVTGK